MSCAVYPSACPPFTFEWLQKFCASRNTYSPKNYEYYQSIRVLWRFAESHFRLQPRIKIMHTIKALHSPSKRSLRWSFWIRIVVLRDFLGLIQYVVSSLPPPLPSFNEKTGRAILIRVFEDLQQSGRNSAVFYKAGAWRCWDDAS